MNWRGAFADSNPAEPETGERNIKKNWSQILILLFKIRDQLRIIFAVSQGNQVQISKTGYHGVSFYYSP